MFLIRRTSAPNYKKKNTALKLCVTVAIWLGNGVWPRKYLQTKYFFFALTPVFSVDFFYNIHSS